VSQADLSVWDAGAHVWAAPKGNFTLMVGASSADIRLRATLPRGA
jgi:hypothetical protein